MHILMTGLKNFLPCWRLLLATIICTSSFDIFKVHFYLEVFLILTYALFGIKICRSLSLEPADKEDAHYGLFSFSDYLVFLFYSSGNLFHLVDQYAYRLHLSVDGSRNFWSTSIEPNKFLLKLWICLGILQYYYNLIEVACLSCWLLMVWSVTNLRFLLFALTRDYEIF